MDSPQTITAIEWFFGYGGNHLGLKRILPGLRLIAACEIEAYSVANLVSKMEAGLLDAAPVWSDCKTFPCEMFRGLVDLFIASYPCQGFSAAGERKGQKDPRFLWPWVLRAIATIQPGRVFLENVEGHVTLGLSTVISDLEEAGYQVKEGIFSAAECGAPQRRKRLFILAQRKCGGRPRVRTVQNAIQKHSAGGVSSPSEELGNARSSESESRRVSGVRREKDSEAGNTGCLAHTQGNGRQKQPARESERGRPGPAGSCEQLAHSEHERREGRERLGSHEKGTSSHGSALQCGSPWHWPQFVARPGESQHEWEPPRVIKTKRGLGGGIDGRSSNVDRLRMLGNGVYPACAARAYITLSRQLD